MNCPKCGMRTTVTETRQVGRDVIRVRICKSCNYRFYTTEFESDYFDGVDKLVQFHKQYREQRKERANGNKTR